nr:MAG TPA: hypothetical protein [Caudoviricetes sp.]
MVDCLFVDFFGQLGVRFPGHYNDAAIASGEPERRRLSHDCYFPGSTPGRLARLDIDAAIVSQAGMDPFWRGSVSHVIGFLAVRFRYPPQNAEMRHPDKVVLNIWFKFLCPAHDEVCLRGYAIDFGGGLLHSG